MIVISLFFSLFLLSSAHSINNANLFEVVYNPLTSRLTETELPAKVSDSTCQSWEFGGEGSAISILGNETEPTNVLKVEKCTFIACISIKDPSANIWYNAGVIRANVYMFEITSCIFNGCSTLRYNGGTMYITATHMNVTGCEFNSNIAGSEAESQSGGAIACQIEEKLYISDTKFVGNKCGQSGSAIHMFSVGDVKITDCLFNANVAGQGTIGIQTSCTGNVEIVNSDFLENSGNPSCFYSQCPFQKLIVKNCTFDENNNNQIILVKNQIQLDLSDIYYDSPYVFFNGEQGISSLNIKNVQIYNCTTAAIATVVTSEYDINIEHFTYEKNGGRAFNIHQAKAITIKNSIFNENTNNEHGGILYVICESIVFDGCTFENNNCNQNGGVAYLTTGSITLENENKFSNNHAGQNGGVFYIVGEVSFFRGESLKLTDNSATIGAALMYFDCKLNTFNITNSHIRSEQVVASGIFFRDPLEVFEFNHVRFENYSGIRISESYSSKFSDCQFDGCTTTTDGASIYVTNTRYLTIESCTFENCIAEKNGGCIFVQSTSKVIIDSCIFTRNEAKTGIGSAIYLQCNTFFPKGNYKLDENFGSCIFYFEPTDCNCPIILKIETTPNLQSQLIYFNGKSGNHVLSLYNSNFEDINTNDPFIKLDHCSLRLSRCNFTSNVSTTNCLIESTLASEISTIFLKNCHIYVTNRDSLFSLNSRSISVVRCTLQGTYQLLHDDSAISHVFIQNSVFTTGSIIFNNLKELSLNTVTFESTHLYISNILKDQAEGTYSRIYILDESNDGDITNERNETAEKEVEETNLIVKHSKFIQSNCIVDSVECNALFEDNLFDKCYTKFTKISSISLIEFTISGINETDPEIRAVTFSEIPSISLFNGDFTNCHNQFFGGAIYFNDCEKCEMSNSNFDHCSAFSEGGAIYCECQLKLIECTFSECQANNGGAISTLGSSLILLKCDVSKRRFTAIHCFCFFPDAVIQIESSCFQQNKGDDLDGIKDILVRYRNQFSIIGNTSFDSSKSSSIYIVNIVQLNLNINIFEQENCKNSGNFNSETNDNAKVLNAIFEDEDPRKQIQRYLL
ncbi:hypothetical protein TRFO_14877 [Tritrichomonas foetus]|uniref:Right handed beta helix domain-containing protein n=1 Tax=Tritrichomonas foetus TaxID=1144522 RepID=A0A1J4KTV7_9EUKA|nr:hypothetical protein TRFO_14877 [Tritrichomonas foetus]|eukprot:OHT14695.1 hypothetical protein TRFO_14877 [Tritrichomonas foetus]